MPLSEPIRDPAKVLAALAAASASHPNQRVMQVIVNALGEDPFYIEDMKAAERLYEYARQS